MFEASRASGRFTRTSHRALLAAGALAAGLTGVGSLTATPAAHADVIGPITFDSQADFDNNFTIVAGESVGSFTIDNQKLLINDRKTSGTDGGYAVVQQSDGSTTFDASQISVSVHVNETGTRNTGHSRRYGPTLFGPQDGSALLQAGISPHGSSFDISLVPNITPGTPGDLGGDGGADRQATASLNDGSDNASGRVVFTADNINSATNTADLTAQYFADSDPATAAATLTLPDYDLAANGLSALGQVGLARTGGRNNRPHYDNYQVQFTPAAPIPEPASLALLGLGGLALLGRRRRS